MTPTQRALKRCRDMGWLVDVVERWIPGGEDRPGVRKDLFGFIDLVAVRTVSDAWGELPTIALQVTTGGQLTARVKKITQERSMEAEAVLLAGWDIQVWGWRKIQGKGRRIWWAKRRRISLGEDDFLVTYLEDL